MHYPFMQNEINSCFFLILTVNGTDDQTPLISVIFVIRVWLSPAFRV